MTVSRIEDRDGKRFLVTETDLSHVEEVDNGRAVISSHDEELEGHAIDLFISRAASDDENSASADVAAESGDGEGCCEGDSEAAAG